MAKKATTTEQSLESIMWNCRNALRGTVGGNDKNRDAVMGLVFLKFAGDKFDKRRKEITEQYGDVPAFLEKKSFYLSENVFYLKMRFFLLTYAVGMKKYTKRNTFNFPMNRLTLLKIYTPTGKQTRTLKRYRNSAARRPNLKSQRKDILLRRVNTSSSLTMTWKSTTLPKWHEFKARCARC